MIEKWKDIKGYEGRYQVSNLGNIKSLNYLRTKKEKELSLLKHTRGYLRIILHKNGKSKKHLVHRLVGETFISNPENKPEINHKDGNRQNNNVNNLEWVTSSENSVHRYRDHIKQTEEERKEKQKEYQKIYYKENKDLLKEKRKDYHKDYYEKNKERKKEYCKNRYKKRNNI